jgi:hypothetical protein
MEGGNLTGDFEGKVNYQGMGRRRFWRLVSLSEGSPVGKLGSGVGLLGTLKDSGRRAPEMEHLSLQGLC